MKSRFENGQLSKKFMNSIKIQNELRKSENIKLLPKDLKKGTSEYKKFKSALENMQ